MAKQVGLFGLRGKIENKSFYKTAGVVDTVIRQIPEGLGSRVKTADEYANTRLNNAEFKDANGIATFAFNAVPSRKSSMMRRFAIAEMTKKALEYIKAGTGNWGARIPSATMDQIIVDLLENRAKSGAYQGEFGDVSVLVEPSGDQQQYTVSAILSDTAAQELKGKEIDGYIALSVRGAMAEIVDGDGFVRQHFGVSSIGVSNVTNIIGGSESHVTFIPSYQTLGLSQAGYTAASAAANNGMYAIMTFVPYRTIGAGMHPLYEHSTFVAVALGAIPAE